MGQKAVVSAAALACGLGVLIAQASGALGQGAPASPPPGATTPVPPDLNDPKTFQPFVYGPLQQSGMTVPAKTPKGKVHLLPATPATTQWGWFDNAQPPVLRIGSGDTVVMETMMHSHNQIVPGI